MKIRLSEDKLLERARNSALKRAIGIYLESVSLHVRPKSNNRPSLVSSVTPSKYMEVTEY